MARVGVGGGGKTAGDGKKGAKAADHSHPRLLCTLKGFSEPVTSATLSPDGALAAAVSTDRSLRVYPGLEHAGEEGWKAPHSLLASISLDHGSTCSFSSNGRNVLVAAAASRRLLAYTTTPKLALKKEFACAAHHPVPVCAALLAPNSKFIITAGGGEDVSVRVWSLGGELLASAPPSKQSMQHGAAISADSGLIAVGCSSHPNPSRAVAPRHGQVPVYQVLYEGGRPRELQLALNIAGHTRGVRAVSFAHDCVHIALASLDGEWSVVRTDVRFDLKQEAKEHARGRAPNGTPFEAVALSPFARRLVGATATTITIVDVDAAARGAASVLETIPSGHGGISSLCYAADGLRALSGGKDGRLRLWRLEDDATKAGTL